MPRPDRRALAALAVAALAAPALTQSADPPPAAAPDTRGGDHATGPQRPAPESPPRRAEAPAPESPPRRAEAPAPGAVGGSYFDTLAVERARNALRQERLRRLELLERMAKARAGIRESQGPADPEGRREGERGTDDTERQARRRTERALQKLGKRLDEVSRRLAALDNGDDAGGDESPLPQARPVALPAVVAVRGQGGDTRAVLRYPDRGGEVTVAEGDTLKGGAEVVAVGVDRVVVDVDGRKRPLAFDLDAEREQGRRPPPAPRPRPADSSPTPGLPPLPGDVER